MKKASQLARYVLILVTAMAFVRTSEAKVEYVQKSRETRLLLNLDGEGNLDLKAKNTTVTIQTWEKNQVEVIAQVIYKGEENDKITQFLEEFEAQVNSLIYQSGDNIDISTDLETPRKVQIGSRLIGVNIDYSQKELDLRYSLKVPSSMAMDIQCSYRDLVIKGNYSRKVEIDHYNGQLTGGNFNDLNLELKYGEAELGTIKYLEATLYEEELTTNSIEEARLEAKYSEIKNLTFINSIMVDFYESELASGSIEQLMGTSKYSKFQNTEHIQKTELTSIYETDFDVGQVGTFRAEESKYCKIFAAKVGYLHLPASYEDKVQVRNLISADLEAPKYMKIEVGTLYEFIKISEGYETDLTIKALSPEAQNVQINGKYMKLYLDPGDSNLMLDVDAKYTKIEFDEALLERKIYIKENDQLQMKVESRNRTGNQTKVILRGYEVDAFLR